MGNWSDPAEYFVHSGVAIFCMGVYNAAFESIHQTYESEEPPLNLHEMVMRILGPPIKSGSSCKHIQVQ